MNSKVTKQIPKFGNEASRRLYRGATDIARKLEQDLGSSSLLNELFSPEITDLRVRLKEYCERLIFTDPVEFGKKAEDLLWRKVYYDFFLKCKQNRKTLMESHPHRSALISHLLAGVGFYHHLLLRIQTEFHIDLEGKADVPLLWHLKGVKKERWKKFCESASIDDSVKSWAEQASHRILIYLGDLERYICELNEPASGHLAERYYQQAFCLNPRNGTPHNQLGSLHSNSRFDSAYHYMRCLTCHDKFDGAEGNLIRVFERNEEVLSHLYSPELLDKESMRSARFSSRILKLCQMFYFKPSEDFGSEVYCQDILKEFDITICSKSFVGEPKKENSCSELTEDVIFKVVIMSLMCVHKLQEKGHPDASVATAFCLALFSYVVDRSTKQLVSSLLQLKVVDSPPCDIRKSKNSLVRSIPMNRGSVSDTSIESEGVVISSKKIPGRKMCLKKFSAGRLRTMRRTRKMSSTSQEDSELSEGEMLDLPESDEENSDASQNGSCSSDSLSENEEDLLIEKENGCLLEENELNGENNMTNICAEVLNESEPKEFNLVNGCQKNSVFDIESILEDGQISSEKIIHILKSNHLLPCLKVLCDWLRINKDILSACAASSQFVLSRLIELLNIFLKLEDKIVMDKEHLLRLKQNGECWKQTYPLPEDINCYGFPLLRNAHLSLDFEVARRRELSTSAQVFLRIQCLLRFGRSILKASESSIDFDSDKNKYYFNLCNKPNKDGVAVPKNIGDSTEKKRQRLMKSMAHLWLKAEVMDLESLVEGGGVSPYLVSDASVLCSSLPALKHLVQSRAFIVVVPLVVIASLDQLKKESIGAREAIRWLESELRKGCRYIRAQRQMEKISLVPMKYPKKKEKEAWDFFQILECCNYLVQQQTEGKKSDCPLVTMLVGSTHHLPDNAFALAQSIDVTIEKLGNFLAKWKNSAKKPG